MNYLKEKMDNFNKRWNITKENDVKENLRKFKIRILNIFSDIDKEIDNNSISIFCQYYWIIERHQANRLWWYISHNIIDKLSSEDKEIELYRIIEIIFSLNYEYWAYKKQEYIKDLKQAIEFSNLNIALADKDWEVILYPAWEGNLDQELVNYALSFLNELSNKHFKDALGFYQWKNYEKTAESLRRSLEEYLRFFLKNTKGLDANIKEISKQIKTGSNVQIRNIITQIFWYLDIYFNENSKHNDWVTEEDAEFLIYQVSLLMRYISRF